MSAPVHGARCPGWVALLVLLLLLDGCTLIRREDGRPVPTELSALRPGLTTKAEAMALLGAPETIQRQFDGDLLTWRWRLARSRSLHLVPVLSVLSLEDGQDGEDRLSLLFDRGGVLLGQGASWDARPGDG